MGLGSGVGLGAASDSDDAGVADAYGMAREGLVQGENWLKGGGGVMDEGRGRVLKGRAGWSAHVTRIGFGFSECGKGLGAASHCGAGGIERTWGGREEVRSTEGQGVKRWGRHTAIAT